MRLLCRDSALQRDVSLTQHILLLVAVNSFTAMGVTRETGSWQTTYADCSASQSKRWCRQDNYDSESGWRTCAAQSTCAAARLRSAGKCNHQPWYRQARPEIDNV